MASVKKLYLVTYNAVLAAAWAYCLYLTFEKPATDAKGLKATYMRLELPLKARALDKDSRMPGWGGRCSERQRKRLAGNPDCSGARDPAQHGRARPRPRGYHGHAGLLAPVAGVGHHGPRPQYHQQDPEVCCFSAAPRR